MYLRFLRAALLLSCDVIECLLAEINHFAARLPSLVDTNAVEAVDQAPAT